MTTITTRAGKGSPLTNNEVDANFTNLNSDKAETDGATLTNVDINSGTIDNTVIGGSTPAAGSFTTGQFDTSLNVDGTVTADGLTVGSGGVLSIGTNNAPTTSDISLSGNAVIGGSTSLNITTGGSGFLVRTGATDASAGYSDGLVALRVADGGDISFYEDEGTTPKLVWKAADERLGIGTSSPSYKTEIADSVSGTFNALKLKNERDDGAADAININFNLSRAGGADRDAGEIKVGKENLWDNSPNSNSYMSFSTMSASSASERMRIDSSGNLDMTAGRW